MYNMLSNHLVNPVMLQSYCDVYITDKKTKALGNGFPKVVEQKTVVQN